MKIALCTDDFNLLNIFQKKTSEQNFELINTKVENILKDHISKNDISSYIFSNNMYYTQKCVENIKKINPYVPIIIILDDYKKNIDKADIYFLKPIENVELFVNSILRSIFIYINNFEKLQKLNIKGLDIINFSNCSYDPTRRILKCRNKEIKKLSVKEGDILYILGLNFKNIIARNIMLEKIWRKDDYFSSRSMDVYISNLRKLFKKNKINLNIKNISKVGLILENN